MSGVVRQLAVIVVALSLSTATFSVPWAQAAQAPSAPATQPGTPQPAAPQVPATPPSAAPGAPVQTFTFEQVVQATLTHNPQIVAADQNVVSAQQSVIEAKAGYGPTVSVNANGALGTANSISNNAAPPSNVGASGSATLAGNVTLFDNGRTRTLVESAQAALASAQATLRKTEQDLALQAGTQFFTVLSNEGVASADQQVLTQAQAQLALVEAQVRAGVAPQADVIQAQAQVAQAQVAVVNAQAQILTAKAALASTMGTDATAPIEVVSPGTPSPQVTVTADEVLAAALQNRPEIAQANASVQSAQAGVDTAYVNAGPQVNISAGAGYTPLATSSGVSNTSTYGVTGTLSLPLFDSGRGHAEIAAAQAGLKSAQASLASTILSVRQDAYQSYLAAVQAAANLTATQAAKAAADQALAVTQGQYRAGVGTIIAVIQAQTTAAQADVNAASAVYTYESALVTLQHAEGAPIVARAGGGAQ
ncbi:MAG TPA: TolC family protein [bacterium]|nr:TolC family protein [bacterium]